MMQTQSQLLLISIFKGVARYLSLKDLLKCQQICHTLKEHVQQILKILLSEIDLDNPNSTTPKNIMIRTIFGRETYHWSFDDSVKPFKRRHILGLAVKSFKVGLTFTGLLTLSNQLLFCTSNEYMDQIIQKPQFTIKHNVKEFSVLGKQRLIYLTNDGDLLIYFSKTQETCLIARNVSIFQCSYFMLIAILNQPTTVFKLENTLAFQLQLLEITTDSLEQMDRYKKIQLPDNDQITQIAIGSSAFYFLSESQHIYQGETLTKPEQPIIKVNLIPFFEKKYIIEIASGLNYFLALGREEIKSIQKWNNIEVQQWLIKIGFLDYVNIVKYNEFTGKEFAENAVKQDFQVDTLGLKNTELQIKLSTEITRASETQFKDYQLYGWGKNDYGQLAIPMSNNVQFQKIPLPSLEEDDEIAQIECGWKNVAILTHSGKLYLTENLQKIQKKEKEQQQQQQQQQQQPQEETVKHRKKSRQEIKEQKEKPQEIKYWNDISKIFIKSNDKRQYKHYYVSLSKEQLVVICSIYDKKLMHNYFKEMLESKEHMHKKFKPTLQVVDRILWDTKFNKDDFSVGYEDRFLGLMEVSFNDYLVSQVKSHRIRYFKQFGKIVWDREHRIDLL